MSDNPFDPSVWQPVDGFELTDITYHRHVVDGEAAADGAGRVRPAGGAQRVSAAHRRRAVPRARPRPDVVRRRRRPADRQRAVAQGRRLGVLLRRRPAHPRPQRLPVRVGRDRRDGGPRARRAAAHPRGAAADPVHAEGRHLPGQRLGRGRRAQPARDVRSDAGQPRARPVQADRRRRRQLRRRLRQCVSGEAGRARSSPARSSSSAARTRPSRCTRWVRSTRSSTTPTWSPLACEWAAAINGKSPQAIRMLKYAFNLTDDGLVGQQLFAGEATRLAYMTDEAVEGRDAFLQKRDPDWSAVPPLLLERFGRANRRSALRKRAEITRLRRRGARRGWS